MRDNSSVALILDSDGRAASRLRLLLEELGFPVVEMDETGAALDLLRAEDKARFVTFFALELPRNRMSGLDHAALIGALLRDDRLAERHIYIAVTESPKTVTMSMGRLLMRLSVSVLAKPYGLGAVREVIVEAIGARSRELAGTR